MGYKLKDKKERNKRLYEFWLSHPDFTYKAIANIFHMTTPRVWIIIQQEKRKAEKES